MRDALADLGKIIANIDEAEGRNDCLRAYIFALRYLQTAHDVGALQQNDEGAMPHRTNRKFYARGLLLNYSSGIQGQVGYEESSKRQKQK